ncbi:MAG TPA: DUF692 family protein [Pirellulaceae bacterium]|nr:DUF692 family protein [Pirellulaceae bacterium]
MIPPIGYALRERIRPLPPDFAADASEITFENTNFEQARVRRDYLSLHTTLVSLGDSNAIDQRYFSRVRMTALALGANSLTARLACKRVTVIGTEIDPFAPPAWTDAVLSATSQRVQMLQNQCEPLRFYLESIAYLYRQPGEMSEAEFLSRLLTRTGCGWSLDVTSVAANAVNFGFDAYEFLAEVLPSAQHLQIYLGGSYFDDEASLELLSSSQPIPELAWDLYRFALNQSRHKVEAIFLRGEQADGSEIRTAHRIATETLRPQAIALRSR